MTAGWKKHCYSKIFSVILLVKISWRIINTNVPKGQNQIL